MISRKIVDVIVRKMVDQVYDPIMDECMKRIAEMLYPVLWKDIPEEIKALRDTELYNYLDLNRVFVIYLPSGGSIDVIIDKKYPKMLQNSEIHNQDILEAAKRYKKLRMESISFRNQLICAISNISTVRKLKNEFPEAYNIYLNISNDSQNNISGCDSIEKVRAELTKLTGRKEETCSQESQPREEQ